MLRLFLYSENIFQCAMCKAAVQSSDKNLAESLNDGITYLMIFPYLLIGILGYVLYKKMKCKF